MAIHAGRALEAIGSTASPQFVEQWLGSELAQRLALSPPRSLSILYNAVAALDDLPWEQLKLGEASLAEHFFFSRQLQASSDAAAGAALQRTDRLDACWLHDGSPPPDAPAKLVAWGAAAHGSTLKSLMKAHVLVLDGLSIARLLEAADWPQRQRLLLVSEPVSLTELLAALDRGAAVLHLGPEEALGGPATQTLLAQLSRGMSVGEAAQTLHRRAPGRCTAKLYGDPQMAFVHARGQTSRRQVSSLSFDIVGSTVLLADLGDEAYAELLAEVYSRCSEVVRRHGGQADEPQGDDGVMGYFGHPWAVEDAAVHAIDAGLDMVGAVADLGIAVRVGIATGLVAVKAGLPFGLSIHLAARLQKAALPGSVLAAAATQKLVAHAFQMQALPIRPLLKGIDDVEPVYQVLGRQALTSGPAGERRRPSVPMVGRQAELDRLHLCWQRTGAGHQRLAVIRGEAGMGKSRLVREFRHQLVTSGVKVLECRCRPDASASPFLSLAEALRRWLNIRDEDLGEPGLRKLVASLPEQARHGEALSWLAALLGLAPPPPAGLVGQFRQRLLGWLVDWFQAFAGTQTSCLIVEDWHWADPSMCEFVDHLMKGRSGPGLMVVVTVRSESDAAPIAALPHESIELGGLSIPASRELLNHVCASQPLSARQVNLLALRGDGVPLFLEEAASMALELGVSSISVDPQALEAVPASLQDLLTARLDGLGSARSVAQVAAVLGRQVSRPLLAALLEASGQALDDVTLDNRLAQLVSAGLMRLDAPGQYAFRHALIRDAAYASLWARERVELHQKVVRLLQQRVQGAAPVPPELLALHQTEAGLHDQALAQWELAAGHAAARSAQHEAISHLRRALAALNHRAPGRTRDQTELRLQLHLASHLLAVEGYGADAVLKSYQQAQALCQRIGDDTVESRAKLSQASRPKLSH